MLRSAVALPLAAALLAAAPAPGSPQGEADPGGARWIWGAWASELERPANEPGVFRRDFEVEGGVVSALFHVAADDRFALFLNGELLARGTDWRAPRRVDVTDRIVSGTNRIEVRARNHSGPAGMIFFADVRPAEGDAIRIESDASWTALRRLGDGEWEPARELAPHGADPWGELEWMPVPTAYGSGPELPIDERFETLPGFAVEEAWTGEGSLVALALDDRGRAIASLESGGLIRLEDADGDGTFEREEALTGAVTGCQGLLFSRGELFAAGEGPEGAGLYRIDPEEPDRPRVLGRFAGEHGEHGAHAVVEGPEGALHLVLGDHVRLAEEPAADSPYRIAYEGHLLPRYPDPRGHAARVAAPGGVVLRVDREGREWSVVAGGLRNAYDLAFDRSGALFALDSDMEWDLGLPWYRPVALLHVVPGGEYGWRSGSAKWPAGYPDRLPPVVELGRGSPTGMVRYEGESFPPRFRGSILAGDWSRGRILALHLERSGASYAAEVEELLVGRPLNVTDLAVAEDGSLLVATGGRGTEGAILRLRHAGPDAPAGGGERAPGGEASVDGGAARFDRGTALAELFEALADDDRWIRYAAARELERRDVALAELPALPPIAAAEALVALARRGLASENGSELGEAARRALELAVRHEDAGARLGALRAIELLLLDEDASAALRAELGPPLLALFPTADRAVDRELAMLVAHLAPEGAVARLLDELVSHPSRVEQIHLAYCLRAIESGWSGSDRDRFAGWLARTGDWRGGFSYRGYLRRILADARRILGPGSGALFANDEAAAEPAWKRLASSGATWEHDRLVAFLARRRGDPRRSAAEGERVFGEACASCHRIEGAADGAGGELGPDLSTVTARFGVSDLVDAILHPSRAIPDAYRAADVRTEDGWVTGVPAVDDGEELVLVRNDGTRVELRAEDVLEREPSPLSPMPSGLLDSFTHEEIADLFAFLEGARGTAAGADRDEWTRLFPGGSLDGWTFDDALWSVEDRTIVGRASGLDGSSFLLSEASWGDFALELDLLVEAGNSGVAFRSERAGEHGLHGYQADAGQVYWGSLYEEGGRGMLHRTPPDVWMPVVDPTGWNHYRIDAGGARLRIEVNGAVTTDLRDDARREGRIGFQLHAGDTQVRIRNARIRAE